MKNSRKNTYAQRLKSIEERFWEKVDKSGDCWNWTASTRNGYGQFTANGTNNAAHRFVLELEGLDIPSGMFICHDCDNKRCVKPDHLYLGTPKENTADAIERNRWGSFKLCAEDIPRIKDMLACNEMNKDVADWFCVDPSTVSRIKSRDQWSHVN